MSTKLELEEELKFARLELERSKESAADYERELDEKDTEVNKLESELWHSNAIIEWAKPYAAKMAEDAIRAGDVGAANDLRDFLGVF